jgi:hypothetical protein
LSRSKKKIAAGCPALNFFVFFIVDFDIIFFLRGGTVYKVEEDIELHVITANEPGILGRVLGTMANAGVNVKALSAYSEEKRGHFRLITSDNKKAEKALRTLGYRVKTNKVIVVELGDRIGAGAEIGALLGNAVIDIDYCYGTSAGLGRAVLVFKTTNQKKAFATLR